MEEDKKYFMSRLPSWVNKIYADSKLFIDKINGYRKIKKQFFDATGYELNLKSPESYNEKIIWKKINNRNPLLTITADKYQVRSYVKKLLGNELADKILIPLYHVTDNPADIPFDELPDKFVVKPNHGSHMHLIIHNKTNETKENIIKTCKEWLKVNYGLYNYEWSYRNIKRKIIIEKLLQTNSGELPMDYKLYCFHGKCKLIRLASNRFGDDFSVSFFDKDWKSLPISNKGYKKEKKSFKKPSNLNDIIALGEKLSSDFDAVRVDLYACDSRIYFGELTHYEGSGFVGFEPESFDFELGAYWSIEKNT